MIGKMVRVFDCQEMPNDVKDYFFKHYGEGKSNDCYINVWIEGDCEISDQDCTNDYDCEKCIHRKYNIVDQWLLDNGAGDETIVKR
jgi:hypothetical protein